MINRNFVFGFALMGIVLCTSCESPRILEEGGYYPKEERFTLKKEALSASMSLVESRLNFDAVYVDPYAWELNSGGTFYRFWPTGQVMAQMFSAPITKNKAENFTRAYLGYYTIEGERITMEFYAPLPGQYSWGYGKSWATFVSEGILKTGTTHGRTAADRPMLFREHDLGDLGKQPHW